MRRLAGAFIREEDWVQFAALCAADGRLPVDYAAWLRLLERAAREARQAHLPWARVLVDVDAFRRWCGTVGLQPDLTSLGVYVVLSRRHARRPGGA